MILAKKTLAAITDSFARDGGATFRKYLGRVIPHMGDAYRSEVDGKRGHLGASKIGEDCARALYYSFHWVGEDARADSYDKKGNLVETGPENEARMLRLWNRGHVEEARFIALLLSIGVRVVQQDAKGKQLRFAMHAGHYSGSMDGIGFGCPDVPAGERVLLEFKTYNDKRFKDLTNNGVAMSDEKYYVQIQQYMGKFGLRWTLFMAVNKNDDMLHAELVEYREDVAQQYQDRALTIIRADRPPPKIRNASSGYYACRFCNFNRLCHLGRPPEKNCRTCQFGHAVMESDERGKGVWRCGRHNRNLTLEEQMNGCEDYRRHPGL